MEISKGIKTEGLALVLTKEKTLIISDIHIGYEEALNKQGILIPRIHFKETYERIENILKKTKPKKIIINGDLKHEHGSISETEWRHTLKVLDLFLKYCKKTILIKGNHDKIIAPITKKKNIKIVDYYKTGNIIILHGDIIPETSDFKTAKTIIMGHVHPAIKLKDKTRSEKYKCFLKGRFMNKELIIMPSFNMVTQGIDILTKKPLEPLHDHNLDKFRVYIIDEKGKVLDFGYVKDLIRL